MCFLVDYGDREKKHRLHFAIAFNKKKEMCSGKHDMGSNNDLVMRYDATQLEDWNH